MERKDISKNPGALIKADIYSRPNAMNGKYRAAQIKLGDLSGIKGSDIFFLETLKMKADLADKMIAEAESQGNDTTDPNVMKELGERINTAGTPIQRSESVMTAIFVSLQLMAYYSIAIGIWGLVFNRSFLSFCFYGVLTGFFISLLSAAPVVASQRTKEKTREMSFSIGSIWGNLGIIIGIIGVIVWVFRVVLFR